MFIISVWVFAVVQVMQGQTITPVYVQINVPVTLTCPADDQATTLTWTGPGGHLWVTGTTVEDSLDGGTSRISTGHSGGSYALMFTQVRARDTGLYTCTVDGIVRLHMLIVQGVTSASPVYTRQGRVVTLQCTDTGVTNPAWQVTSPVVFTYTIGTQLNPSIPMSLRTRLSVTRQDGIYSLQISDVQLSDVREYRCSMGTTSTFFHLLLYILPTFPGIENTVAVDGQNRTTGTEDGSLTLTCNARGGIPSANVTWIKDGVSLVTSENRVQYTKVFTRADGRTQFTCQSSSPALTIPQTTSVLVYLELKPQQPTISDQSSQTENADLQVVCVSTGSRPAADIEWNVGGTWLSSNPVDVKVLDSSTDTYTVTSSLSHRVIRQDNGKSVYCRVSNRALSGGIESVRQTITVLYGPNTVGITGNRVMVADGTNTLTLTCITQEYSRHVHITWYNGTARIPNTAAVTNTSGSYGGFISTQDLQLVPDRYQDGNVVRCVVQNEDVTVGERTASVTLDIRYRPFLMLTARSGEKVIEGSEIEIQCDVDSNPAPSSITWSKVRGQIPPDADVTSGVLRIPSTDRTDRGTYRCVAVNSIGSDEDTILIDIYSFTENDCSKSELYTTGVALISVSSAFLLVVVVVTVVMVTKIRKINHRNKPDNQEIELSKKVLSDTGYSAEGTASSKYVNTDITTANPESVSVYEDIAEQPHGMSITEERSNTYESLGRRSAPNVYEGLSTRKSELDTAYEDTIIKTEVQLTYQNQQQADN